MSWPAPSIIMGHFYGALDMQSVAGRGRGKREKRGGKKREKSEGKERRCHFPSTPPYFHVLYTRREIHYCDIETQDFDNG
jgi:hypothetical protein